MNKITLLCVLLVGCGIDMTGVEGDFSDAVVLGDTPERGRVEVPDAEPAAVETVDAKVATDLAVTPPQPDTAKLPDLVPESIVPRRVGITCTRDDQCGEHAGTCINGVCTACKGEACGKCTSGPVFGFACPVLGTTASACAYCVDDNRLWCDGTHPCPSGSCSASDCR